VINHSLGIVAHAAHAATNVGALRKANQLNIGLINSATALQTLDRIFEHLEDMCLFMYLFPTPEDGENPVREETARERFRSSINQCIE